MAGIVCCDTYVTETFTFGLFFHSFHNTHTDKSQSIRYQWTCTYISQNGSYEPYGHLEAWLHQYQAAKPGPINLSKQEPQHHMKITSFLRSPCIIGCSSPYVGFISMIVTVPAKSFVYSGIVIISL